MKKKSIALMLTLALWKQVCSLGAEETLKKETKKKVENEKAGEISFAWWGNEDRQKYTEELLDQYEKEHEDVSFVTSPTSWDGYWEKACYADCRRKLPGYRTDGLCIYCHLCGKWYTYGSSEVHR